MDELIVIVADEHYAAPATALLRSIGDTWAGQRPPSVRLLGRWGRRSWDRLRRSADVAECLVSHADPGTDSRLPTRGHWTTAAYARLSLETSCSDARRVICMDSDMIALVSMHELLSFDLRGAVLGATHDLCVEAGLPSRAASGYFNSGLLLVDIGAWTAARTGPQSLELVTRSATALEYIDQSALNQVLRDQWLELDQRWNVFHFDELLASGQLPQGLRSAGTTDRLDGLQRDACCVHYVGPTKPWLAGYPDGRNKRRFSKYVDTSVRTGREAPAL